MEDLFHAGGVPAVMNRIQDLLHGDCETVNGKTIAENISGAHSAERQRDSSARSAAVSRRRHRGLARKSRTERGRDQAERGVPGFVAASRARVRLRNSRPKCSPQVERDDLPVDRNTVLVMRNCGPKGAPGFPEWGHIPMPRKLLNEGVTDMVRISDARMSGTSYGTVVLHVAPESAIGGPLALVETGDEILLDVPGPQTGVTGRRRGTGSPRAAVSRRRHATTTAATAVCSWTTSRKPIWVAISIF